jgi:hypothetical protein
VVTVRNNCILNVTLCSLVGVTDVSGTYRLYSDKTENAVNIAATYLSNYSTPRLKHFWVYVTTWVANLTEQKSLCVCNQVSSMARLVPTVRWEHNFVILWCDKLRHYLMITHPRRCLRHRITNYFSFIKYVDRIRMRIQNVKEHQKEEDILCAHSGADTQSMFQSEVLAAVSRPSFGKWRRVVRYKSTDVSEKRPASISQTRSRWLIIDNLTLNMRYVPPKHQ